MADSGLSSTLPPRRTLWAARFTLSPLFGFIVQETPTAHHSPGMYRLTVTRDTSRKPKAKRNPSVIP